MIDVSVTNEIGALKKVIIHRPDAGIGRVTPKRAEELLFDDIVYLPLMQQEHDTFTRILTSFCGEDAIITYQELLTEALAIDSEATATMLERITQFYKLDSKLKTLLKGLSNYDLAQTLISGYHAASDQDLFDPTPNFLFTRDVAITVNDHVVLAKAATKARVRENFLAKFIFLTHPDFSQLREEDRIIDLNDTEIFNTDEFGNDISIEGGDAMVLTPEHLLIGLSERTNEHTARELAKELFRRHVIDNVVIVEIPNDRAFMHLDTIFTQIDEDVYAAYGPIIKDGQNSWVEVLNKEGVNKRYESVEEFLIAEVSPKARVIACGSGKSPQQEREQWTDACNLVALRPGVAITYDRNHVTAQNFRENGYQVVQAPQLLAAIDSGITEPKKLNKIIIALPSGELSRARGGGHCMTCPIYRLKLR